MAQISLDWFGLVFCSVRFVFAFCFRVFDKLTILVSNNNKKRTPVEKVRIKGKDMNQMNMHLSEARVSEQTSD